MARASRVPSRFGESIHRLPSATPRCLHVSETGFRSFGLGRFDGDNQTPGVNPDFPVEHYLSKMWGGSKILAQNYVVSLANVFGHRGRVCRQEIILISKPFIGHLQRRKPPIQQTEMPT